MTDQKVTIIPDNDNGYEIEDVVVDGEPQGTIDEYTFNDISEDHSLYAKFKLKSFTISPSGDGNVDIYPSNNTTVQYGSDQIFQFIPNDDYRVSDIIVDGLSVGYGNYYNFENVTEDHDFNVLTGPSSFTISASAEMGGFISPSGNVSVNGGESATFEMSAIDTYYLSNIIVDNVSIGLSSSYTFENVTENHIINVLAEPEPVFRFSTTSTGTFTLPLVNTGDYDFIVDGGDGQTDNITTYDDPNRTHLYDSSNIYNISITGTIKGWKFNGAGSDDEIANISEGGPLKLGSEGYNFYGCSNLTITATDVLDLSECTNLTRCFSICNSLTTIPSINDGDFSNVETTFYMFYNSDSFNQPLTGGNLESCTNMEYFMGGSSSFNSEVSFYTPLVETFQSMFYGISNFNSPVTLDFSSCTTLIEMFRNCVNFDQDISNWNVSNVENFSSMFFNAYDFNQPLNTGDTSSATNMNRMFYTCKAFNQDISGWNVSNVTDMNRMFYACEAFNQDISGWNVSNVTDMGHMFRACDNFNQSLSGGDVSNVENFEYTFAQTVTFNEDITSGDLSSCTSIDSMFYASEAFNQDISGWNVSNITNFNNVFDSSEAFDQDISGWDVSNGTTFKNMFDSAIFNSKLDNGTFHSGANLSGMFGGANNFNQDISSWDVSNVTNFSSMFRGATTFDTSINTGDTSSATTMAYMFLGASSFNQPVSNFDTSGVSSFYYMFRDASSFNQDVSNGDITSATDLRYFLYNATSFSTINYDLLLVGGEAQDVNNNLTIHVGTTKYSGGAPATARAALISDHNGTIYDGGIV